MLNGASNPAPHSFGTTPRFFKVFGPDSGKCSHVDHVACLFIEMDSSLELPAFPIERDGMDTDAACIGGTIPVLVSSNAFNNAEMNIYLSILAPPSKSATQVLQ